MALIPLAWGGQGGESASPRSISLPDFLMARKAFLLRIDPDVLAAVQRLADADLRSLNAQIEFLLREALTRRDGKSSKRIEEETREENE